MNRETKKKRSDESCLYDNIPKRENIADVFGKLDYDAGDAVLLLGRP